MPSKPNKKRETKKEEAQVTIPVKEKKTTKSYHLSVLKLEGHESYRAILTAENGFETYWTNPKDTGTKPKIVEQRTYKVDSITGAVTEVK